MKSKTVNDYLNEANSEIKTINSKEAKSNLDKFLFIDVRDKYEREKDPVIDDAILLSRGMLEFYADKSSPYYNEVLNTKKKIIIFCTLGARGAMATKTLQDMGYDNVYNLEKGLQDWNS